MVSSWLSPYALSCGGTIQPGMVIFAEPSGTLGRGGRSLQVVPRLALWSPMSLMVSRPRREALLLQLAFAILSFAARSGVSWP